MPSAEQRILLKLLGAALFDAPLPKAEGVDWDAVLEESLAQSVQPLAFAGAQPILPPEKLPAWKKAAALRLAQNIACRAEYAEAADCLRASGASFTMLKGTASARYYPLPELRTMGDVDFFVPEAQRPAAEAEILKRGFVRRYELGDPKIEWIYRRPPKSSWEMHAQINGMPQNAAGETARRLLSELCGRSEIIKTAEGSYPVPQAFHHGLILLLHTAHHLTDSGVGLRHFCDWAVFAAAVSERFEAMFRDALTELGLWRFAQVLTRCAERALGMPGQSYTREVEDDLADRLTEDLLNTGDLGKKDRARMDQRNYLWDRSSSKVSTLPAPIQLLHNITAAAKRDCPKAAEHPILLPWAWLKTAARCGMELISGKRTLGDRRLRKAAQAHRRLYGQLALFEGKKDEG